MEPNEHSGERSGVPTFIIEAVVAALVVVMGIIVIQGSRSLGSGWTSDWNRMPAPAMHRMTPM